MLSRKAIFSLSLCTVFSGTPLFANNSLDDAKKENLHHLLDQSFSEFNDHSRLSEKEVKDLEKHYRFLHTKISEEMKRHAHFGLFAPQAVAMATGMKGVSLATGDYGHGDMSGWISLIFGAPLGLLLFSPITVPTSIAMGAGGLVTGLVSGTIAKIRSNPSKFSKLMSQGIEELAHAVAQYRTTLSQQVQDFAKANDADHDGAELLTARQEVKSLLTKNFYLSSNNHDEMYTQLTQLVNLSQSEFYSITESQDILLMIFSSLISQDKASIDDFQTLFTHYNAIDATKRADIILAVYLFTQQNASNEWTEWLQLLRQKQHSIK